MQANTKELVAALARVPLFAGIQPATLERVAGRASIVVAAPGHMVMDFNDETTDVLFVIEGVLRVSVHAADGEHTRTLGDFQAGEFVGEISAIDGAPRSARVMALVRTRYCLLPANTFLQVAAEEPAVGLRVMQLLTARIRAQNQALIEHTTLPTRLRVAVELLRMARPRADGTLVVSPLPTGEELASRVGARRETVSREMTALARLGLLQRTRTTIVLPNPRGLKAAVQRALDGTP